MNERQRRFCEFYAQSPNATEAAIRAGFSPRTARAQGSRLLKNVSICQYIRELQDSLASERIADVAEVKATLTGFLRDEDIRTPSRIHAANLLLKSAVADRPTIQEEAPAYEDTDDDSDETVIVLPWIPARAEQQPTHYQDDDGELHPLPPADPDGSVKIYITADQWRRLTHPDEYRRIDEIDEDEKERA